jgi:hypothetical protein
LIPENCPVIPSPSFLAISILTGFRLVRITAGLR